MDSVIIAIAFFWLIQSASDLYLREKVRRLENELKHLRDTTRKQTGWIRKNTDRLIDLTGETTIELGKIKIDGESFMRGLTK